MIEDILMEYFWNTGANGDTSLRRSELGLAHALQKEAMSDNPETIFRHYTTIYRSLCYHGINLC